jgi:hypothetical protein
MSPHSSSQEERPLPTAAVMEPSGRKWSAGKTSFLARTMLLGCAFSIASISAHSQPVVLDPARDGIMLGAGVAFAGASELVQAFASPLSGDIDLGLAEELDRLLMPPYSSRIDTASDLFEVAALVMPLSFFLLMEPGQAVSSAVVCLEVYSFADGAKNFGKFLLPRRRPYTYTGGTQGGVEPSEDDRSFPSGHATMSFAAASACTFLFARQFPDSAFVVPFALLNYSLAAVTASLRVAAGVHFLSDILAGAALGTLIGYAVPLARTGN